MKLDLGKAIATGVNQASTYPLFSFPYSTVGRYCKLKKVKMPNLAIRRKMYMTIHDYLCRQGFQRVSVWGFKRGDLPRYSSVTPSVFGICKLLKIGVLSGAGVE